MFFKNCVGFALSNCLNAKTNTFWNLIYTIHHSFERSYTTKCIQYNIHDTKSYELPKYLFVHYPYLLTTFLQAKLVRYSSQMTIRYSAHSLFVRTTQRRYLHTQLHTRLTELLMTRCPLCVASLYTHVFRTFSK